MSSEFPLYLNGKWSKSDQVLVVKSPYDQHIVGKTWKAGPDEIEQAIRGAVSAFEVTKKLPLYEKAEKLLYTAQAIQDNLEEIAQVLSGEAGKPIKAARAEVSRAVLTFTDAAEESKRIRGEYMPLDFETGSKNRWAILKRFPIGPILGISPFNFPLNLVCHKVAPALAAGNTVILKPASQTPLSALMLARLIDTAGWPAGTLNVLPMDSSNAHLLVEDERIKMLTFTGSPEVGWKLKPAAGRKKVTLELGGNGGVIVHKDADIEYAATRCTYGGFILSGQNCISVQRIYLHDDIYNAFMNSFIPKVQALKTGDPALEETDIGPLINPGETERVIDWIEEAKSQGATVLTGGKVEDNIVLPTIMTKVKPEMKISCQEIFGPLVNIFRYSDINDALGQVNNSEFGLQAGLFTNDAGIIYKAFDVLEVGGVIAGDIPTYRIDPMPYGGVKGSGTGREGARFAIEEMTEPKLLVVNQMVRD
jgi:acyl-CoA reductase-like NAD-dependent aldehyde dehydrogenase